MNDAKKYSVLIVDDERQNIKALSRILDSEYTVHVEINGKDAIESAEKFVPDVILLDILMPEMDGYDVIRALKSSEKTQNIPVIFISGLSDVDDERKGLALGAVDYITKPFSPVIVELRVRNQINILNQMRVIIEKERAEKQSRAQIDFLMRMSHEMLTSMNAAMGMTQILKMQVLKLRDIPDTMIGCYNEIDAAHRYLLRLIHDLLDVSGKMEGAFRLADSAFSFHAMFRKILKGIGREAAKKRQALTDSIDPSVPAQLYGDEERLAQVLTHLLTNAVKFTPEHGAVHIAARATPEEDGTVTLRVEVTDNGKGISKERQSKIFNLFEQCEASMETGERGGIGLGLPISKRIAEMMGGKILVESELDKGSKFTFVCKMRV